ncbi:mechanosensitive ion channel domain-containing protein [Photobacterium sp.]|uniref:mechanosensitive ion channel domain-containing protein n=1 Tax=Photobacterium sp. TaxID=660 RepID=UPI00299CD854|nr:mechanosensitive ion channel domain-containing protein [Photobacterium sp.]MDX1302964.1 mechanosensitive ion channel [Photobacterium sp.]
MIISCYLGQDDLRKARINSYNFPAHNFSENSFPAKFFIFLILLTTLSFIAPVSSAEEGRIQVLSLPIKSTDQARLLLDSARQELANLPEDPQASELELQSKATWQRRITLLEEYIAQADSLFLIEQKATDLADQVKQVNSQLVKIAALPPVQSSTEASQTDSVFMESRLNDARSRKSNLLARQAQQQQLEADLPELLQAVQRRVQEAEQREAMLSKTMLKPQAAAERLLTEKQIENVRLDSLVARQAATLYEAQFQWYQQSEPLLQLELELAELQINRQEQQLESYHQLLQQRLAEQAQQAEQTLIKKEESAQNADNPGERFIATWEAQIARSQKNTRELQSLLISLNQDVTEQEKWFNAEKDEFLAITNLLSSPDNYAAADRIKLTLQQISQRRSLLIRTLRNDRFQTLNLYRERRFTIADSLLGLTEQFELLRSEIADQLDENERGRFQAASQGLLFTYRNTLRDEKAALTEVISQGQKLQLVTEQRLENLNQFEHIIRSTSFWIRDSRPLGWQTLVILPNEIMKDASWLAKLASPEIRSRLTNAGKTPINLLYTLVLFLILPIGLYQTRAYLRGFSHSINDRVQAEGKLLYLSGLVVITALLSAALIPAYFYVVARLADSAQLPAGIGSVSSQIFEHFSLFFFLWFLSRSFFARRSISEIQFGFPHSAANALYSALKWFLFGFLIWLLPWNVFRQPPFENEVLPRIFYTLFLITSAIGVYKLTRPGSAFVQHALETLKFEPIFRHWKLLYGILNILAWAVILLEVAGYHYASLSITLSLTGTLIVLTLLPPIYRLFRGRMHAFVKRSRMLTPEPHGNLVTHRELRTKYVRVLRLIFIILGAILLLNLWGINEQALRTFDDMQLYKVRITGAEPEFVTFGDILRGILLLVVTIWILRVLPGLFNLWVFPHWNVDAGIKYAILTISRYSIFLVGFFFALAELHLDLGRLSWLMAAIGVGLGFGLQEIVSNFVSGIILLVERPVKPGDTVTIGNLSGTVSRINIRATTIVNFDRQEVMVPNRSLITNDVINWTRSDTVNRVVISIGVAYGSDVDRVSELLMKIATEQPEILTIPEPTVIFMRHGESSLDLDLRVFVPSPDDIMPIRDRLNRLISKTFSKEGIEIPFPQRDLHIRSGDIGVFMKEN